jgi:hypothetical protein
MECYSLALFRLFTLCYFLICGLSYSAYALELIPANHASIYIVNNGLAYGLGIACYGIAAAISRAEKTLWRCALFRNGQCLMILGNILKIAK